MADRGNGRVFRRGKTWWIAYYVDGREIRESSRSQTKATASRLLRERLVDASRDGRPARNAVTVGDLLDLVRIDYKARGLRSHRSLEYWLGPLERCLDRHRRADRVSTGLLEAYAARRRAEGLSSSTVRTELSRLARGYRLAVQKRFLSPGHVPHVPIPPEDKARIRQGFFTEPEMLALATAVDALERPAIGDLIRFLFYSAWRIGEARKLSWDNFDPEARAFRLRPDQEKLNLGRVLPVTDRLAPVVERRLAARQQPCKHVFHRGGRPVGDIRKTWRQGLHDARLPESRIPHDLRRSGIKWLIENGVDTRRAMAFSGHQTDATLRRYQIADVEALRDAADQAGKRATKRRRRPARKSRRR